MTGTAHQSLLADFFTTTVGKAAGTFFVGATDFAGWAAVFAAFPLSFLAARWFRVIPLDAEAFVATAPSPATIFIVLAGELVLVDVKVFRAGGAHEHEE